MGVALNKVLWGLFFMIPCKGIEFLQTVVEITNTMHKFAPLLYSYILAPTCFGSSLPSSFHFHVTQTDPEAPRVLIISTTSNNARYEH
jgi:hypothetical protein